MSRSRPVVQTLALAVFAGCIVSTSLTAQAPAGSAWPTAIAPLAPGFALSEGTLIAVNYDEARFRSGSSEVVKRGRFTRTYLNRVPESFHEPAEAAWKKWEPVLKAKGWMLKAQDGDTYYLQKLEGPNESWLSVSLGEYNSPLLALIQQPASPRKLDLVAPAATRERVSNTQEFPFLKAFAGFKLEGTGSSDFPLNATVPGVDKEPRLVGQGFVYKYYTPLANLSKLETELIYRDALTRAGWTVIGADDGRLVAHYASNGRDIWAVIGRGNDDSSTGFAVNVADVGAEDWAKQLATTCHLPLFGVTFDFDKATIRSESTSTLQKAADVLSSNATLNVEVQGHADDVGDEAYNVRLSGQRADAVRAWLGQHGIAAARLTSKGYGKTQPLVENSSDDNRARNRRVELACRK